MGCSLEACDPWGLHSFETGDTCKVICNDSADLQLAWDSQQSADLNLLYKRPETFNDQLISTKPANHLDDTSISFSTKKGGPL